MKVRLITSAVGLSLMALVLVFFNTLLLEIVIVMITGLAVHEILSVKKLHQKKFLTAVCLFFSGALPLLLSYADKYIILLAFLAFVFSLFFLLIVQHETLTIYDITYALAMSSLIPLPFAMIIMTKVTVEDFNILPCLIFLGSAWLADGGAYFIGVFFGKHKLAPNISPKKTIEGAVGGVVVSVLCMMLGGFIAQLIINAMGFHISVYYPVLALFGLIGAIVGLLGDLFFSVIKRQNDIKDFGTIIPGHGGILDRFDSVLFVIPCIYLVMKFIPFMEIL